MISSGLSSFVIPAGVTPHECPVLNEATSLVSVFAEVPEVSQGLFHCLLLTVSGEDMFS